MLEVLVLERARACPAGSSRSCPRHAAPRRRSPRWKASIMAGGQAEPPITVRVSVEKRSCSASCGPAASARPSARRPRRSPSRPRSARRPILPSSAGPGNTSLAPTSAAEYGMPQALTWNIGTTGSTESRADSAHDVGQGRGVGVQDGGAVAVQRRLRVAGGAATCSTCSTPSSRRSWAMRTRSAGRRSRSS